MTFKLEPQIYSTFLGIREYNGVNSGGAVSAILANNVELYQTDLGSGIGVRSTTGNAILYSVEGYNIYGCFPSVQDNVNYLFLYGENEEKGALFYVNHLNTPEIIIDNLPKTGDCNGLTMTSTAYDVFVFTNGQKVYTVCFAQEPKVKEIVAVDYQGRSLKWLSMTVWNGFLVAATQYGVHASHKNDIYVWNDNPEDAADSWYIDFSKKVTAVYSFSSGIFIFTEDDISRLIGNPNEANSSLEIVAMNGTLNAHSVISHDIYLFFYDPKQKNVYYMEITDTGQTRPNGPAAKEIQSYFDRRIDKLKMYSCIYGGRNELWLLINDDVLIFDYAQKEWVRRNEQKINSLCLYNSKVLSCADEGSIFAEKINEDFSGEYMPAEYKTTYINFGSNSNLKKEKTPLLLILNDNYTNDFFVELTINGRKRTPKRVRVVQTQEGIYGDDNDELITPKNQTYDEARYASDDRYSKRIAEVPVPAFWYTMSIRFFTSGKGQGFAVNSMELKNIRAKIKTRGK